MLFLLSKVTLCCFKLRKQNISLQLERLFLCSYCQYGDTAEAEVGETDWTMINNSNLTSRRPREGERQTGAFALVDFRTDKR